MPHLVIPKRQYPETDIHVFHSAFKNHVHLAVVSDGDEGVDLTPSEAKRLRKALKSAIREAEETA